MLWLIPLLPVLAAPLLGLAGRLTGRDGEPRRGLLAALAVAAAAATATAAAFAAQGGWRGELAWSGAIVLELDLSWRAARASAVLAVLVPAVAAPILAYAAYHQKERGLGRLLALLTLFVGAMELLVAAADLVTMLIGWELVGACSWGLIAHRWRDPQHPRAATGAFLVTRAGDLGLFLAAAAAFAGTGTFSYRALPELSGAPLHLLVAGVLLAAAAKSAQLPFSPWLFAAMKGPVPVSALLHAATMVAAGAFLVVRLHPVLDRAEWFGPAAVTIGLATALTAGGVATLQPHAKQLLAASTSAHYGLMFVAAGAGYPAVALLHLAVHAAFKAALFLAAGIAGSCAGGFRLARMRLGRALPGIAAASGVATLALAGVPPLGGAWSKEEVVTAAGHFAPWAAALVAVAGALSAVYAARFQFQAFGRGAPDACGDSPPRAVERLAVGALAAATLALSALWWPGARHWLGRVLDGEVPSPKPWELVVSLLLVAAGIAAGRALATRRPRLGESGPAAVATDWLGLPALGRAAIVRPVAATAGALARFDDQVLDAPARWTGTLGPRLAGGLARADRRVVDTGIETAAGMAAALARVLGGADRRVIDAGVEATGRAATFLARLGDALAERGFDAVPEGLSHAAGAAGRVARRLQTGLAHHYYTLIVAGLALIAVILVFGE